MSYYIRKEIGCRWYNFPYAAYRGAEYPWGVMLGVYVTRRGAMRAIAKRKREDARPEREYVTEYVSLVDG